MSAKSATGGFRMNRKAGLVTTNRGVATRGTAGRIDAREADHIGPALFASWRGARRSALLAGTALALVLAAPQVVKAQGIEDISEDVALIVQPVAISQANDVPFGLFVNQANTAATALLDLNTADSDPISIFNNLPIVTIAPGEDGILGRSSAAGIVLIDVDIDQSNTNTFSQSDLDELDQDQEVEQENENALFVTVDNAAFADDVSIANQASIVADGHGTNALSDALAQVEITDTVDQTNLNQLAGTAPDLDQDQDVDQDNEHEADITVLNQAFSGNVSVSNSGITVATLNGDNAASVAEAETEISDTVTQTNTNELVGTAEELEQEQEVEQENLSDQDFAALTAATSGYVSVDESGVVTAGGTGIEAETEADADTDIEQTVTQTNANSATANLSLEVESEDEPGETEAEAEFEQEQEAERDEWQQNESEQEADAIASAAYVGDGTAATVYQSGIVDAGGDGVAPIGSDEAGGSDASLVTAGLGRADGERADWSSPQAMAVAANTATATTRCVRAITGRSNGHASAPPDRTRLLGCPRGGTTGCSTA